MRRTFSHTGMNRRRILRASGTLAGVSLLAGCIDELMREAREERTPGSIEDMDTIKGIRYFHLSKEQGIPMEELRVVEGPNCDGEHYHAREGGTVTTTVCEEIADPGGCGFGKVSETPIRDVVQFDYPCSDS